MPWFKLITIASIIFTVPFTTQAQHIDIASIPNSKIDTGSLNYNWQAANIKRRLHAKSFIIPTIMIGYGFTALDNNGLKNLNVEFKDEMYAENPHKQIPLDNYLQFAPAAAVYGLNAFGIKSKNNLLDRSMIYVMSTVILTGTVTALKKITVVQRPDESAYTSFPSGHTAEAFASAEFMRMEYKDVSPWYGIAGYAMATTTGYLRMYNNKHWFSDVVAGAGVGIASTKIAYWLYPKLKQLLFKDKLSNTVIMPAYQNGAIMVGMVHKF